MRPPSRCIFFDLNGLSFPGYYPGFRKQSLLTERVLEGNGDIESATERAKRSRSAYGEAVLILVGRCTRGGLGRFVWL
jgi:hypothetical protein